MFNSLPDSPEGTDWVVLNERNEHEGLGEHALVQPNKDLITRTAPGAFL